MATEKEAMPIVVNFDAIHATIAMIFELELDELQLNMVIRRGQYLPLTVQI